jgi:hypothetical protein
VLVELLFDVNFAILQDEMELISVRVTICGECLCVGCEKTSNNVQKRHSSLSEQWKRIDIMHH